MSFFKKLFDGLDKPIFKDWIFYLFLASLASQLNNAVTPAPGKSPIAGLLLVLIIGVPASYLFFLFLPVKLRNNYRNKNGGNSKGSNPMMIVHVLLGIATLGLWTLISFFLNSSKKSSGYYAEKKKYMDACAQISLIESSISSRENALTTIKKLDETNIPSFTIMTFSGVTLREVREGERTTVSKGDFSGSMRSGTVGISGKHIGIAATSGKMKGKTSSTSVTFPAQESITDIDEGKVVVQNSLIAFAGGKYSRSAKFSDVISWGSSGNQISFSVLGGDKVWVLRFQGYTDSELVKSILTLAESDPARLVGQKELGSLKDSINEEISFLKSELVELEEIRTDYLALENKK